MLIAVSLGAVAAYAELLRRRLEKTRRAIEAMLARDRSRGLSAAQMRFLHVLLDRQAKKSARAKSELHDGGLELVGRAFARELDSMTALTSDEANWWIVHLKADMGK